MIGSARRLGRIPRVSTAPLLGPAEIRQMAARAGIQPTKTLGQNFVIDANTIRRIVTTARVDAGEVVLEVGPGLGSLTLGLLDAAARVVAVEIDPPLAAQLPETVRRFRPESADRLDVVLHDALTVTELPAQPDALVANLPYNVAVPVLLHLLAQFPSITHGLVMVQD
ncbi:16S rRNA (adenine(1518)-N(6)/adenine(1519)-N(6))-dimethyltransferase RsmA, partial [Staphylococcus sp. EG-SA-29]|nr:16S rRNA (adenine(1518)-N(6)/adenine(1519)-N(6))-dimethyltransferase RsmA [Staphylococcus sp. EG-SA-29]